MRRENGDGPPHKPGLYNSKKWENVKEVARQGEK